MLKCLTFMSMKFITIKKLLSQTEGRDKTTSFFYTLMIFFHILLIIQCVLSLVNASECKLE